ncbi:Na+:solute symporter [Myxococcota bacterium]|nr:Na+:solute symporter [Myxococcota bacterium]MBU1430345.1 Na+:solute symporter [Myxococcota bacterium]MBU1896881.1 Na+:solute symporter [Myxococcota bacterium]
MRALTPLDLGVIIAYLLIVFLLGLWATRKASASIEHFFIGGRSMPWWLLGVSMAATNFSIDTPISVTGFVGREGIGGVWFFWSGAISAVLVTFLFARLWRRAAVITDAELIELRYDGRAAAGLRLFKGFYFGVLFNAFIMGWVFLALSKVLGGLTDLDIDMLLWITTGLAFIYTVASGFYGVVITDFFQYFIAVLGALLLAIFAVAEVGGLSGLVEGLSQHPQIGPRVLDFLPSFSEDSALPASAFLTYLLVQWWAHKYADGGGKHIQRMLSAKNEDHAVAATLFFAFANYALQIWPWILTALAALLLFGPMTDPELGYAMMMARVLPSGLLGLVLACLIGAFMSTIDTHLNLGASYVVNDIYKRFIRPEAEARHYVLISRLVMAGLLILAVLLSKSMTSVGGAWKFLLTFSSGAGLTWIVRWFWWRANAWTELSGMITSGVVATYLQINHGDWGYAAKLLTTVGVTTAVWLIITLATPPTSLEQRRRFAGRLRLSGAGWGGAEGGSSLRFLARALGLWLLAVIALFSLNFALGALLLGRHQLGLWLLATALLSGGAVARFIRA